APARTTRRCGRTRPSRTSGLRTSTCGGAPPSQVLPLVVEVPLLGLHRQRALDAVDQPAVETLLAEEALQRLLVHRTAHAVDPALVEAERGEPRLLGLVRQ